MSDPYTGGCQVGVYFSRGVHPNNTFSSDLVVPAPGRRRLLICHGVLAPRARWRGRVVVYGRLAPEPTASTALRAAGLGESGVKATPRAWDLGGSHAPGLRHRRAGVSPVWGPAALDRHAARFPPSSRRSSGPSPPPIRDRVLARALPSTPPPHADRIGLGRGARRRLFVARRHLGCVDRSVGRLTAAVCLA